MIGNAAAAMQFFLALVAVVVIGIYLWMYAAHCFSVVVDETAAGIDEVKWPDLPLIDWAGRLIYLTWLALMAAVPVWLGVAVAAPELLEGPLGVVPVFLGAVWLLFPVFLLSALSGPSRFVLLHPGLLRRLVRRPLSLLMFYLLSGVMLFGAGILGVLALRYAILLLLAAPLGTAAFLIHARLLGRLAWLLAYRTPVSAKGAGKKKPPKRERAVAVEDPWAFPEDAGVPTVDVEEVPPPAEESPIPDAADMQAESPAARPAEAAEAQEDEWTPRKQPYALLDGPAPTAARLPARRAPVAPSVPENQEDEWTPRKRPYVVLGEGQVPKPPVPPQPPEPPPESYAIRAAETVPTISSTAIQAQPTLADAPTATAAPGRDRLPEMPGVTRPIELWLYERQQDPVPRWPFFSGVFNFPAYPSVLRAWAYLALMGLIWSGLLKLLLGSAILTQV